MYILLSQNRCQGKNHALLVNCIIADDGHTTSDHFTLKFALISVFFPEYFVEVHASTCGERFSSYYAHLTHSLFA